MIERRSLKRGGFDYRVRWRDGGRGSKLQSRSFARRADAERFETELKRRRQLGELAHAEPSRQTVDEFAREWWGRHATKNLAPKTLELYAWVWDKHVLPRIGDVPLRRLTPSIVEQFKCDMQADGVGDPTVLKALALLQNVCRSAIIWDRIENNPVTPVRKPSQRRARAVRPLPPTVIEQLRGAVGREEDAVLISLLAYAGLRPGEALALVWADIGERTIHVERAVADGAVKSTKTGRSRSVRLLAPLAVDLKALRLRCGRPAEEQLLFVRGDGGVWRATDWKNWRKRVFDHACRQIRLEGACPYHLRHSFVSLLIAEGRSVVEVARQAGHAPTMSLDTYGHVFAELDGADRQSAEDLIRAARQAHQAEPGQVEIAIPAAQSVGVTARSNQKERAADG